MVPVIPEMSVNELAELEIRNGAAVTILGGRWWRRVRPCFYRPLFPFEEIPTASLYPLASRIGAAQHLVPNGTATNSHVNFLLSEQPQAYSRRDLGKSFRYQLRKAEGLFEMRPIMSAAEFATKGYPVYVEFLNRTGYSYRADRIRYAKFQGWTETLLRFPVLVLGAFGNYEHDHINSDRLVAICVSYVVEGVAYYATSFTDNVAMHLHVSDLMLHAVREAAAALPRVKCVYAGMATGSRRDSFYLLRGFKIAKRPALLAGNSLSLFLLKSFAPDSYSKLLGNDIAVEGAEDLCREIRIDKTVEDEESKKVELSKGAHVDVTVEADKKDTTLARKH